MEKQSLQEKIINKQAQIGIIGMGYVGYALAHLIAKKEFSVLGFDINKAKVTRINKENKKNLHATTNNTLLAKCDICIVCVQTPVHKNRTPDLSFVKEALYTIKKYHNKEQLVIIESTIAPGTTSTIALPTLLQGKKKVKNRFFLAFSPERIDPGNKQFSIDKIPKIVAGVNNESLILIQEFYNQIFQKIVPVSSVEAAEMTKILENTFRLVNISLINELTTYTNSIHVDMWEVINAAATKPFGFLAHYPGPGIGGHCIPVDPYYLLNDAQKRGINLSLVQQAGNINEQQPTKVVTRAMEIIRQHETIPQHIPASLPTQQLFLESNSLGLLSGTKGGSQNISLDKTRYNVLLIGIAYKKNIRDIRESPAIKILKLLEKKECQVFYHDPYVKKFQTYFSSPLTENTIQKQDLVVIVSNHAIINYEKLANYGIPILDTTHLYPKGVYQNVYYL